MKSDEMKCLTVIRFLIGLVSIRDLANLNGSINISQTDRAADYAEAI